MRCVFAKPIPGSRTVPGFLRSGHDGAGAASDVTQTETERERGQNGLGDTHAMHALALLHAAPHCTMLLTMRIKKREPPVGTNWCSSRLPCDSCTAHLMAWLLIVCSMGTPGALPADCGLHYSLLALWAAQGGGGLLTSHLFALLCLVSLVKQCFA